MIENKIKILPNIRKLYSGKKLEKYGIYNDLVQVTNTNAWDGSKGWKSPRRWQRKSWVFFGAYSADIFVGFAIIDAGFLGKAFCYIYYPKSGKILENGIDRPFAFGNEFEANLDSHWKLGKYQIYKKNGKIHFEFLGKKFQVKVQCDNNDNGLSFLCPSTGGKRPFHFTYKNLLLPTQIQLTQKGQKQTFSDLYGGIDFSKGYPPKHTNWNWTSFIGRLEDGTPVGINVVDQFNKNMENVIWLDTERILIGDVLYSYNKPLTKSEWIVKSVNGNLELKMNPNGSRKENINLKLIKSKFIQVFGAIEGKIKHKGTWKKLTGFGVMEEHEAIW
ncbi:MAG: DUF2804 domain-containing protein [Saprospiraceae bacterium]|nr:DUF2804 domain-containing protein [Saprospiraceae bacterium]